MKLYILTDSTPEANYTPQVFKTKEEAVKALEELYDKYIAEYDYVDSEVFYETHAEVIYVDDTYNTLDIFEVEI